MGIALFKEPVKVLNRIENKGYTGMSDFELSFLCGAIKKFKPVKIVEIGVAAGGTTAVILNCLKILNYTCEMYSVDICTQCYLDRTKKTGFIAEKMLKEFPVDLVKHQFLLGNTIAVSLDEIGKDIDFVILDTMHSLPGELLDFISLYNSLRENAVIVFHDVGQSQLGIGHIHGAPYEYASLVTLAVMQGQRYLPYDDARVTGIANIGAIELNRNTPNSIENMFLALLINWNYMPDPRSLEQYRQRIKKEYDKNYYFMFERAVEINMFSLYRQKKISIPLKRIKGELDNAISKADKVYIYGAGKIGNKVKNYINSIYGENTVSGYIISSGSEKEMGTVRELQSIEKMDHAVIVLGLDEKFHLEVLDNLHHKGFSQYVFPYNGIGFREFMELIEYYDRLHNEEMYENAYAYAQTIKKGVEG